MFSRAHASILTVFFLILIAQGYTQTAKGEVEEKNEGRFFSLIEDKLEVKVGEYVNYFTKWLEDFNDKHLGRSELGRLLHYEDIKPNLEKEIGRTRNKKMSMAMMPLIFHVGATSTWMLLTSIMAAKSVAIGLALLVFKIAVSSAKLASFFTLLKGKQHDDHHHGWAWSPPPHHYEHHGHDRSFSEIDHHIEHQTHDHHQSDWHSYSPEWTPNEIQDYHTIPSGPSSGSYKSEEASYLAAEDRKKIIDERRKKRS